MAICITHIRLSGTTKNHEYITDYKWQEDGTVNSGTSPKATMVDWIGNKNITAYVSNGYVKANVAVVNPSGGSPYLRTHADGVWTDNLLSLPTF